MENEIIESAKIADGLAIRVTVESIVALAEELQIQSADDVSIAEAFLLKCRAARERVESFLGPHIKRAFEQHRALTADRKALTDQIDRAEKILKPKMADFLYREEQRLLEEARERERIRVKIENEAGNTADKAHALVKAGDNDAAAEVIESGYAKVEALEQSMPAVSTAIKPDEFVSRTRWDFEITDPKAVPDKFKMWVIDEKMVRVAVERMKEQFNEPGIRAFPVRTVVKKANR